MKMFELTGRVAVVTGGNGGIGFGIAKGFARAGAFVVLAARDVSKSKSRAEELQALGADACAVELDVRHEESCWRAIEHTLEQYRRLDILVNNAGVNIRKLPQEYSLSDWHTIVDTNLRGTFLCCQAAHSAMARGGGGKIINIGSMQSIFGGEFTAPLASSKGGIVQLTKCLAVAWAKDNIQANAVLPGWIDTELTRRGSQRVPGLKERIISRTPAGRWGVADDLAGIAVFLASGASDFITGAAITVDGGFSIQG